jgi:signal transduction histidine kinase
VVSRITRTMFASLLAWLMVVTANVAFAGTLLIDGTLRDFAFGDRVEELEDITGEASLEQVRRSNDWLASEVAEPNKGFTDSTWWFRFSIITTDPGKALWYLMINDAILNQIDAFFLLPSGEVKHYAGGGWVPVDQRYVPYRTHIFQIPGIRHHKIEVYLKVKSELAVVLPISVLDGQRFMEHVTKETWVYTLYLGFMAAMLFFNMVVYFRMRDKANLLYCFFAACMILIAVSFCGLGRQFFWTKTPQADNYVFSLAVAMAAVSATLFTENFQFGNSRNAIRWQRERRAIIIFIGVLSVAFTLSANVFIGVQLGVIGCILSLSNILVNSFVAAYRGFPNATLLIVAWIGLISGAVVFSLRGFGLLPSNAFTTNIMQIASLFECFLLVVALVEKSRTMQREMDNIAAQTLERLEHEVAERTADLRAAENKLKANQKRKSLESLSASISDNLIPSINGIRSETDRASQAISSFRGWLLTLADGEDSPAKEIDDLFIKIERSIPLINEGADRVSFILRRLSTEKSAVKLDNHLQWGSAESLLNTILNTLHINASIHIAASPDASISISPSAWCDIMTEVLKNARDALNEAGKEANETSLHIEIKETPDSFECKIIDAGIGIPEHIRDRLFDPFFTTRAVGSGVGLGLTRAREIMQQSGGTIRLDPREPGGTVCVMSWRRAPYHA